MTFDCFCFTRIIFVFLSFDRSINGNRYYLFIRDCMIIAFPYSFVAKKRHANILHITTNMSFSDTKKCQKIQKSVYIAFLVYFSSHQNTYSYHQFIFKISGSGQQIFYVPSVQVGATRANQLLQIKAIEHINMVIDYVHCLIEYDILYLTSLTQS